MPIIHNRDMPLRREAYQAAMENMESEERHVLRDALLKVQDSIGGGKSLTALEILAAVGTWLVKHTV